MIPVKMATLYENLAVSSGHSAEQATSCKARPQALLTGLKSCLPCL